MIKGNTCPVCNKSITTFRQFLISKTKQCQHCGTKVSIKNSFIALLLACVVLGLAVPTFILGTVSLPDPIAALSGEMKIILLLSYLVIWWFVSVLLGWSFIGWQKAEGH